MRKYKMLKDGIIETDTTEEQLRIGEVHSEFIVDSLCSLDFDKSVNCEAIIDCIDCLAKCGVIELIVG